MNTKKILIGVGIVVVLALGMTFPRTNPVVQQITQQLGANAGPDRFNPCESANGITTCFNKVSLIQASTTICSIVSPAATSTLVYGSLHMNVATTGGATTLTFAMAVPGASASTTVINGGNLSVGAGAEANALASTTRLFPPNYRFNVTQAGGGSFIGGTFSETGVCQAVFNTVI